ncbi:MAG TPA: FKBP-type peptidyl-prolyl cis-trans isomerase [Candidatus Brocadiia bacterium]|nr:FKBP-type peptidyl-prolyl cis-trans isomerase [Candidatus Brocadiia bacterium]
MDRWLAAAVVLALAPIITAAEEKAPDLKLDSETAKFSYALGQEIGQSLKNLPTPLDTAIMFRAIEDVLKDAKPQLTADEARQVKMNVFQKMQQERERKNKEDGAKNLKAGEDFLAKNKGKKGVITTPSGLQYEILKQGDGASPKATDTVKVHYAGKLLDGTEFDSSYGRGQPTTFPCNRVIAGWTEALQLMKVGGKYRLYIPAKLAYGERGAGPKIGPNSTLIFDVELLGIETPADAPATPAAK